MALSTQKMPGMPEREPVTVSLSQLTGHQPTVGAFIGTWIEPLNFPDPEVDEKDLFRRVLNSASKSFVTVQLDRLAIDLLLIGAAAVAAFYVRTAMWLPAALDLRHIPRMAPAECLAFLFVYCAINILCCHNYGLYRGDWKQNFREEACSIWKAVIVATIIVAVSTRLSGFYILSRSVVLLAGMFNAITLPSWRAWHRQHHLHRGPAGNSVRNVLIVGSSRTGQDLAAFLHANHHLGYCFRGFLDDV